MSGRRNEDRMRFRYGKCLNESCEKCKSKEVIAVPGRKEFVCPDCGSKLFECAPPRKGSNTPLIVGIAVGVCTLAGVGIWLMSGSSPKSQPIQDETIVTASADSTGAPEDTLTAVPAPEPEPTVEQKVAEKPKAAQKKETTAPTPQKASSEHKLGYGVWKGGWRNGKPHDTHGTMRYTEAHLIDSRDPKKRMAEPGDYIIGEWADGKLVQGVWYDSSNTVKGSILIGQ